MTTNYSAAIDTSDIVLAYCEEVTWGTSPTTNYTALRVTGESLSESKQRTRPAEINPSGVVSHALTTQVAVEGAINFALSATTFDAFIAAALNSAFAGNSVSNATAVTTFTIQKQLAAALFLQYAGCYVTSFSLNAAVGGFVEGSFGLIAKNEATGIATLGTVDAAPVGRVIDTVAGVAGLELNGTPLTVPIQSLQLNLTKQNARSQFAIGSSASQGLGRGTIDLNGTVSMYFKDFTMYNLYKSETDVSLELDLLDDLGAGYHLTLPAVTLMNPSIVAGGPDTDVMAEFQLEGNPDENNVILTIDQVAP
jgi:hypothetical protein